MARASSRASASAPSRYCERKLLAVRPNFSWQSGRACRATTHCEFELIFEMVWLVCSFHLSSRHSSLAQVHLFGEPYLGRSGFRVTISMIAFIPRIHGYTHTHCYRISPHMMRNRRDDRKDSTAPRTTRASVLVCGVFQERPVIMSVPGCLKRCAVGGPWVTDADESGVNVVVVVVGGGGR